MKDAKGHGSNPHLEGGAAHQSMVRKMLAAGQTREAMGHALTRYDREQETKTAAGRGHYNHYALGQYMGAADRAMETMKSGASLGDAINEHFTGPLANRMHKAMGTGMKARR